MLVRTRVLGEDGKELPFLVHTVAVVFADLISSASS